MPLAHTVQPAALVSGQLNPCQNGLIFLSVLSTSNSLPVGPQAGQRAAERAAERDREDAALRPCRASTDGQPAGCTDVWLRTSRQVFVPILT